MNPVEEFHLEIERLRSLVAIYEAIMLTKQQVASRAGMTVSWLNNSQSSKAIRMRALGVRYGRSHFSPVRYPAAAVAALCLESEDGVGDRQPPRPST